MPAASKKSYGPTVQVRARHLLQVILGVVADDDRTGGIKFNADWADATPPKLTIETTLQDLTRLTNPNLNANTPEFKRAKVKVGEALGNLQNFVQILDDHRTQEKGSDKWRFSLQLWGKDADRNLAEFDKLWESKRSPNSQPKSAPEINQEPISEKSFESSAPKLSSDRNLQPTSGYSQGHISLGEQGDKAARKTLLMLPAMPDSRDSQAWRKDMTAIRKSLKTCQTVQLEDGSDIEGISGLTEELTRINPCILHIIAVIRLLKHDLRGCQFLADSSSSG